MPFKNWRRILLVFLLGMFFCHSVLGESGEVDRKKREESKGLVRKDMLSGERRELTSSKRNIFVPSSSGMDWEDAAALGQGLAVPSESGRFNTGVSTPESEISPELKYIGYVISGQKIVGLIIFQEEALSVEKGDVIAEGVEVVGLNRQEIEIIGLGDESKKFPLEGEKQ